MKDAGVVAAKALEVLATLGFDRRQVAGHVGCHERTVRRWETGQHQPSKRNRAVLRRWISELFMAETSKTQTGLVRARVARLEVAAAALKTHAEKAEEARFQTEMLARRDAIIAERQSRRSAFADLSPFQVFGQQDAEMTAVEAMFA